VGKGCFALAAMASSRLVSSVGSGNVHVGFGMTFFRALICAGMGEEFKK